MSQFSAPPVNVITTPGGQQAESLANTLMQKATLDAQTKLEQQRIDSQQKLAEQQMSHEAEEHLKYQQFQAQQNSQAQGAQAEQNRLDHESTEAYRNKLMEKQDKLLEAHKVASKAKMDFIAQTMRDKAGMSAARKPAYDKLQSESRRIQGALGAAQLEFEKTTTGQALALDKVKKMSDQMSGAALTLRNNTKELTSFGISQGILDSKNYPGFWDKVRQDYVTVPKGFTGSTIARAGQTVAGVRGELYDQLENNISDWFGGDSDVRSTAFTDVATFAEVASDQIAKRMVGVAKGSTGGLKGSIQNFIVAGANAHAAMSGNASQDNVASAQARFDKSLAELKNVIPDEAILGIADSLKDVESSFTKTKGSDTSLFRSERDARRNVINMISGVGQVLDHRMADENAPVKVRQVDKGIGDALATWVGARASMSMTVDDFTQEMVRNGLKPKDIAELLKASKELFGNRTPEKINEYITKLKGEQTDLGFETERQKTLDEELGLLDTADTLSKFTGDLSKAVD